MARAARLLDLIQLLRRHRRPVAGRALADELGISLRTLYRDIATLQAQGADIAGEPGIGYELRPGFLLPPLMFGDEQIEALVLGSRWVAAHGDARLAAAARDALARIVAVLPPVLREAALAAPLLVAPPTPSSDGHMADIRAAIRGERKLSLTYIDRHGRETARVIWPFALGFFENARVVAAWCESRDDYRHFRLDRISALTDMQTRYPRRQRAMLRAWRAREQVGDA